MKVRTDFVTNSSSSSYVVVYKVDMSEELMQYMAEEYGRYGTRLMKECISPGKKINELLDGYSIDPEIFLDNNEIHEDGFYLFASRESYSDEGCIEGDDAWLVDHIPGKYMQEICTEGDH